MDAADLSSSPPPPSRVVTPSDDSQGQDLLGLRAPAERIAISLMNGVTTISPLIRYLGFRAWVIRRYTDLRGPNDATTFLAFAAKCEATLVLGHRLAQLPSDRMVGGDRAGALIARGGPLLAGRLTRIIAMQTYAGPSQDLGFTMRRPAIPHLSKERGVPLADELHTIFEGQPALMQLEVGAAEQAIQASDATDLAHAFSIAKPEGNERARLIDALSPAEPRAGELSRIAAYAYLLALAQRPGFALEEPAVLNDALLGGGDVPSSLYDVPDGWHRFLVRDMLAAAHELAVEVVLDLLGRRPHLTESVDRVLGSVAALDIGPVFEQIGLMSLNAGSPIRALWQAVHDSCLSLSVRSGLTRWSGPLSETLVIDALQANVTVDGLALLPVAWILAELRTQAGLEDQSLSIDHQSGASQARLGIRSVIAPQVRAWRTSAESIGSVVARLVRRSIDQHLMVAWARMQAAPDRSVAVLVSDGQTWTAQGKLRAGRATSRLYQAINWLRQLGLIDDHGITADGAELLSQSLQLIESPGIIA